MLNFTIDSERSKWIFGNKQIYLLFCLACTQLRVHACMMECLCVCVIFVWMCVCCKFSGDIIFRII